MAFATKSLRGLYKIYNGTAGITYCALRRPVTRIPLIQAAQKYCYCTNEKYRTKITGRLTNIQLAADAAQTVAQVQIDQQKQDEERQKEEQDEKQNRERTQRTMKFSLMFLGTSMSMALIYVIYEFGLPPHDENGNAIEDEFSHLPLPSQIYGRVKREINYYTKLVQEPSRDKLLPDTLKEPYIQPPYTLVLELIDVLVHPDWTYQTGWRFKKRPGLDQFLEALAPPQFEIVIYTAEQGMTVFPIVDALDPRGYIMYRLVRDATRFVDGHHVKDLDALNRDLKKVIVVDWNSESVKFHPENMLQIPKWSGNNDDTALYNLAALLKTIHAEEVADVRDVLTYYKQFDDPLKEFRQNQQKLLQMEEEEAKAQTENKVLASKWKPSFLQKP